MRGVTSKIKIIALVSIFILFATGMYLFGYGIMASRNQELTDTIAKRNVDLEVLQREQKSFEQGKKDLAILQKSQYPPDELFSSDTKVVKEIQLMESSAQRYNIDLTINVTGSQQDAMPVAGTSSQLSAIPYTLTLNGPFGNILMFMQSAEHMPFVTHVNNLSLTVSAGDKSRATIGSEFYIKK